MPRTVSVARWMGQATQSKRSLWIPYGVDWGEVRRGCKKGVKAARLPGEGAQGNAGDIVWTEANMDFHRVLRTLNRFLVDHEIPYGVIGGVGLSAYGIVRMTIDLDFVIDRQAQAQVVAFLESQGYETLHQSEGYSNHCHSDLARGRVDIVYIRGETSRRVFAATRTLPGPGNLQVLVPCPEHLAAMKVVAMKNDPDRTLQDLADIRKLMRLPDVDHQTIRASFKKHGLEERFLELERSL